MWGTYGSKGRGERKREPKKEKKKSKVESKNRTRKSKTQMRDFTDLALPGRGPSHRSGKPNLEAQITFIMIFARASGASHSRPLLRTRAWREGCKSEGLSEFQDRGDNARRPGDGEWHRCVKIMIASPSIPSIWVRHSKLRLTEKIALMPALQASSTMMATIVSVRHVL